MNINAAIAQANRFDRAKKLIEEGYTFTDMGDGCGIAVCKPGKLAAAYWIDGPFHMGCDCPDYTKNGLPCKHMLAWEGIKAAEAEEAAMMETQAAEYDASRYNMQLPELPKLTTLTALHQRIVKDLEKAEPLANQADIIPTTQRVTRYTWKRDLEGALNVVNRYIGKELVGLL